MAFKSNIACMCLFQSLKVLRTSEFLPYVVFLQCPDFEVLKAMNRSAVEAGVVTKTLTVGGKKIPLSSNYTDCVSQMRNLKPSCVLCAAG